MVRTASQLTTLYLIVGLVGITFGADPFAGVRGKVQIGQTLKESRVGIPYREMTFAESSELLSLEPWAGTHCFLLSAFKEKRVLVWTDDKDAFLGWPMYIFATFSPEGKLIDLVGSHYGYTEPLVQGSYTAQLAGIKKGMNVSEMYKLVGSQKPTYKQDDRGEWKVHFTYNGYKGRFFHIEAKAATGVIVDAGDLTL